MYFKHATSFLPSLLVSFAALASPVLARDLIPIDRGRYVQSSKACDDPQGSMLFIYDGKSVKGDKTACTISNVTKAGNVYAFDESCAYRHHWWSVLPTTMTRFKTRIDIRSQGSFV